MTDLPSARRAGKFNAKDNLLLGSWAFSEALDSPCRGPKHGFEVLTSLLGEDDDLDFKSFSSSYFLLSLLCCLELWNENTLNKLSEDIRVQI